MKRRDFIITTVAGAGVISISTYFLTRDVEYDPVLAQPKSLSPIWDDQTINSIGTQYRANTPGESSTRALVKLLEAGPIDESITNDFATEKTVVVDGWILSVTEARQCAIASTISK
jgi:hypothetical protein